MDQENFWREDRPVTAEALLGKRIGGFDACLRPRDGFVLRHRLRLERADDLRVAGLVERSELFGRQGLELHLGKLRLRHRAGNEELSRHVEQNAPADSRRRLNKLCGLP
jgi:hypothetical protein